MPYIDSNLSIAWLIPLLPLLGFLFNGFVNNGLMGGRIPKAIAGGFATLMVFLSFGIACYLFAQVSGMPDGSKQIIVPGLSWMTVPTDPSGIHSLKINFELLIDPLSVLMMLIITGVGGLIHLYSTGYMAADKGYSRFFAYLNLFVFFMLLLVMSNNLLLLFVGWEGVGLCSYLLIGYFFEKKSAGDAAKKAFIVNRIGDVGVLIGMFLLFHYFGTLDFLQGTAQVPGILQNISVLSLATPTIITTIMLMLFLGCTGKSAQIPLYTWLPDAMEGPTPVSALIHAATMVTAGVYLISRTHVLFQLSETAMVTVAVTGIATALFAATIGLMQNDIKRVLAYSTVSQLGYMFAACGAGAFAAGMYHVMTHAFFKACLFLGSGSVIHAMEHGLHAHGQSHEEDPAHAEHGDSADTAGGAITGPDPHDPQDMRNMGGLFRRIPVTAVSMIAATLAISGIWPFAGYYSKDEILWRTFVAGQTINVTTGWVFWGVGAVTALITAFYMFRLVMKTFFGTPRTDAARQAPESSLSMIVPIGILALLSFVACWPALPLLNFERFSAFLAPSVTTPGYAPAYLGDPHMEQYLGWGILAVIVLVILACVFRYRNAKDGLVLSPAQRNEFLPRVIYNKYFVDEAYNYWFVHLGKQFSDWLWKSFDLHGVDGIVNGVGDSVRETGSALKVWQNGYVRSYAFSIVGGIVIILGIVVGRSLNW